MAGFPASWGCGAALRGVCSPSEAPSAILAPALPQPPSGVSGSPATQTVLEFCLSIRF